MAFTLAEVLIAIGILGIGLTMASALFPAAIMRNGSSVNDTLGLTICENGLMIAKAVLNDSDVPGAPMFLGVIADEKHEAVISKLDQHYPQGTDDGDLDPGEKMKGFVLLGRTLQSLVDPDPILRPKLLVAVSYARSKGNKVVAEWVKGCTIDYNNQESRYELTDHKGYARAGGYVIFKDGSYARIVSVLDDKNKTAILDHKLRSDSQARYWFIVETGTATNPAMAVMVTRTALPQ